jgi:SAM-dependent methyltransferase
MTVEQFFTLFLEELKQHESLWRYYKFHQSASASAFDFRKAYFCQRLQYILDQFRSSALTSSPPDPLTIWDCGCGYATTQIFLALNGFPSKGSTLEFYYKEIPRRLKYWQQFGDMSLVEVNYEDIFKAEMEANSTDVVIVQDTLHHLEPLQESLAIFHRILRPGGKVLAIEENGNNVVQNLKLYHQRGNKRIIEYYDEGLGRMVMMGNENIRPLSNWKAEFSKAGFRLEDESVQYVRLFPPFFFGKKRWEKVAAKEQRLWRRHPLLREYFFFGVNFIASKPKG